MILYSLAFHIIENTFWDTKMVVKLKQIRSKEMHRKKRNDQTLLNGRKKKKF